VIIAGETMGMSYYVAIIDLCDVVTPRQATPARKLSRMIPGLH
jgi:hypothetical protein